MILHLLRHAEAEDVASSDFTRELTPRGRSQAASVADFLVRTGVVPDLILSSPYRRTLQTAQAICKKYPAVTFVETPELGCGLSPQTALAVLERHGAAEQILWVGHQPDLSILAGYLLSIDQSVRIAFDKASLLTLEMDVAAQASGVLLSHVRVAQMSERQSST